VAQNRFALLWQHQSALQLGAFSTDETRGVVDDNLSLLSGKIKTPALRGGRAGAHLLHNREKMNKWK